MEQSPEALHAEMQHHCDSELGHAALSLGLAATSILPAIRAGLEISQGNNSAVELAVTAVGVGLSILCARKSVAEGAKATAIEATYHTQVDAQR